MLDRCHDAHTDGSRPARRFPRPSRTRAAMARDGSIEPRETRAVSLAEGQVRHWEWNRARRRSSSGAGSTAGREPQRSDADQDVLRDICAPTVVAPREGRRPAFETVPASSPESAIPSPARGRCAPLTAYEEEPVEQGLVLEDEWTQVGGKREDPVEVADRKERLALGLQPLFAALALAIRTMPIPASEGSPMRGTAEGTLPQRPADAAGVAVTEAIQDVEGVRGLGIQTGKLREEASEDGSHGGTVGGRSPATGRLHQRLGWRSVRISPRGLLTCPMRSWRTWR